MKTLVLLTLVTFTGCDRFTSRIKDDPVVDAAPAPVITASALPSATVTASASASASAAVAPKPAPKCPSGESFVEMGDGVRGCATACIDPSCDCRTGFIVLPNGKASTAPGDMRSFCLKAKTAAKKALPKCGSGLSLVAEDDSSTPFCAKPCGGDADCKPAKCDAQAFNVDAQTGAVFTGVGKSFPICAKAAPATAPCPAGSSNAGGVLKTCSKVCTLGGKCPTGTKCDEALLVCR